MTGLPKYVEGEYDSDTDLEESSDSSSDDKVKK